MRFLVLATLVILGSWANRTSSTTSVGGDKRCKCFPGDACWPSRREWDRFNKTVQGRLVRTAPLGSLCHDPQYDAALCEELRSEWRFPSVQ